MTDDSILCHERLAIVGVGKFSFFVPSNPPTLRGRLFVCQLCSGVLKSVVYPTMAGELPRPSRKIRPSSGEVGGARRPRLRAMEGCQRYQA